MTAGETFLTDLYELTMVRGYLEAGMHEVAAFELFVRDLPRSRGFLVAAGLEQAVTFLEGLHFMPAELDELAKSRAVTDGLAACLRGLRFTGDMDAIPEGTVVFENEPLLRIVAPIAEAQFVETRLINLIHFQTVIASAAARLVLSAPDHVLVDFGVRRAHGWEAGLYAARASYLAGFQGTSTVLAGIRFGIPLYGTMAHSYVEAHDEEIDAFRTFARANADRVVFLIDTYDVELAAHKVVALAREGIVARAVRIDSGNLAEHARRVRRILDAGGLRGCSIFVSGGLDDHSLRAIVGSGAPIDGFGIGTRLDTSADAPYLDCAYKLVEYAGRARRKLSEGKVSWPGRKQVYRQSDERGRMYADAVTLDGDELPGTPLLVPMMRGGRRVYGRESLETIRARSSEQMARLPEHLRSLAVDPAFPVRMSPALMQLAAQLDSAA